ncbi:MAG: hypothetical protein AMJ43_03755 [Coxiella sp. DG_40]|nr:MAG: hypothetical protein AMJ43_03755 [Coxiella sp. DG_40]
MQNKIIIGRFGSTYGIKGWIKIISFTDPKVKILQYQPWWIKKNQQWQQIDIEDSKCHGKNIIVKLHDIDNCDQAKTYTNIDINIQHDQLPKLPKDEYYWSDLEGLTVLDKSGKKLGIVDHLIETGSNDVLVIKNGKQHLIPYIDNVIIKVDLKKKIIKVDWELL